MKWFCIAMVVFSVVGKSLAAESKTGRLKEAEEHNNRGVRLAANGRYDEAVEAFRSAIRVAPEMVASYFNLGLAYARLDEFVRAQEAFETAARIRPENGNVWFHLGRALQSQEKNREALEAYTMALRLKPRDPDIRYWLGIASWLERDWAQAAAQWEALIVENPDHSAVPKAWEELPRAFYNLGTARHASGELAKAAEAYGEALRLRPDYADAHLNLGDVYRDQERHVEAVEALLEAERLRPEDIRAHLALGGVYLHLDSLHSARDRYLKVLELDEDSTDGRYGLATALVRSGEVKEALKVALGLLERAPNEVRSHRLLAFLYEYNDEGVRYGDGYRAQDAVTAYKNALRLTPYDATLLYNLGAIFGRQGQWLKSRKVFHQALAIDSTHAGVLKWLPVVEVNIAGEGTTEK